MSNEKNRTKPRRGIYLLPNLFTTAALFSGFYGILSAINGLYENAAIAIFIAMILDGLDGRVARMTNTQSAFGAEYDSLSDMVSFGLAPALVMYLWAIKDLGKFGWFAAFIYTACAALRLARFNTQVGIADKRYFQGLPSPAAAAIIAGSISAALNLELSPDTLAVGLGIMTTILGLLMVSNVRYHSFKDIDFKGKVPFVFLVAVMLTFAITLWNPPIILFSIFMLYALSGPVLTLKHLREKRATRRKNKLKDEHHG